jgi:hypothetical protein
MVRSNDLMYSQIDVLKRNVERYIKDKNEGLAPAALNADAIGGLGHEMPSIEGDGMRLEARDYESRYFPPHTGNAKSSLSRHNAKATDRTVFAAILQITMGVFNATSEPRQATADDSLAGRCESAFGECPDVDWFP